MKGGTCMNELRLKELRLKSSMFQTEVAALLHTSQSHYQRLESGKTYPNSKQILRLCEIFKCTPNEIFGFHGKYKVSMDQLDQD